MKPKFWILENGKERKATYKEFRYWYDNFCSSVMDVKGNICDKGEVSIRKVEILYNGNGYAVAGRIIK